jgi:hypothetical protein
MASLEHDQCSANSLTVQGFPRVIRGLHTPYGAWHFGASRKRRRSRKPAIFRLRSLEVLVPLISTRASELGAGS